jgi:hypothetical protein
MKHRSLEGQDHYDKVSIDCIKEVDAFINTFTKGEKP